MAAAAMTRRVHPADWAARIAESEWAIYEAVLDAAISNNIPFALGGAFGLSTYTGGWRNTKDLDLYIRPADRERMIAATAQAGLTDYYDRVPYDRRWIYRATSQGVIVDTIWAMANQRSQVDERWMRGPRVIVRGRVIKVVPPEAVLWDKLYIIQRERCDWPDIMNLLYHQGAHLDWDAVLAQLGEDIPLLAGALSVFAWLAPGKAHQLPGWLWDRVELPAPKGRRTQAVQRRHAAWLDTRPWFAQPPAKP